ncbi:MAG: bifunctional riboflavin kinase/FAD synthetase [Actinomycetota bacterium]
MIVAHSLEEIPSSLKPTAISIGVFDGMHTGHQMILREVIERATQINATPGVVTFDRHPLELIAPGKEPALITTVAQRASAMDELGLGFVLILKFDPELRSLRADEFVRKILVEGLDVRHVVVGSNFRFGFNHEGTVETLEDLGEKFGFEVEVFSLLGGSDTISSTLIRRQIAEGQIEKVTQELGRPFRIEGVVEHGAKRGKGLGFPTANLRIEHKMAIPKIGVYAGWLIIDGARHPAVVNVGLNPTFETRQTPIVEAHVLDFDGDLYGKTVELEFTHRLRDELRFDGPDPLIKAIEDDIARARQLLNLS